MSIFDRIARLLTFGSAGPSDLSARTLEAAYRRQSETLQDARRSVVELIAVEKQLSAAAGSGENAGWLGERVAELRARRIVLESTTEKLRLRIELFRTEKLAVGASYVAAGAASRSGETLANLAREAAEVTRMVERAKAVVSELQASSDLEREEPSERRP
jgi:phage shock protein A